MESPIQSQATPLPAELPYTARLDGFGAEHPSLLFVGDAALSPDEKKLMLAMIKAMNLELATQVFVADFFSGISGWPQDDTFIEKQELLGSYLQSQQQIRCVVSLGVGGAKLLHGTEVVIQDIKSRWNDCSLAPNTATYSTYHPRDMLKRPESKRPAWADLQAILKFLNETTL